MAKPDSANAALADFHPTVAAWFAESFPSPTHAQAQAWPLVKSGQSTLVAAPTGSGKTLTAFLAALDDLVHESQTLGKALPDEIRVVYVSPLKALSNDIHVNLQRPLEGISNRLQSLGLPDPSIRVGVRTGDTPQRERQQMARRPPQVLVTTPESRYVLLGSDSGRRMLATTRSVIVDEIHAMAGGKRGSHLALSLERLQALCGRSLVRIGLSATQKPIDAVARFLAGQDPQGLPRPCAVVDIGHARQRDLALEVPPTPLEAVMSNDVWEWVYDRLAQLSAEHRTTLVFVNTRRMAERLSRHLTDRLGKAAVAAHHGSLAKEHRLDAEQRLKRGELRVLVATASLELGIDIGDVDLVCQMGSPRSIASFLQRVGRSGHQVGGTPKGRLFPTSRDDLIECAALLDCVRRGELDVLRIPTAPLDVLAQQIVAEVACQEWNEGALFELLRQAQPYASLTRARFDEMLSMLAEGYHGQRGTRGALLHRDTVNGTVRARRGGKLTAVTSGGTIPENADYTVMLEPQGLSIGTVNEDFAVESLAGDIFQLGNASYRILRIESGRVRVEDAQGQPPNIPFWLGEAPGRSDELSAGVSRLRAHIDRLLPSPDPTGSGDGPADLQASDSRFKSGALEDAAMRLDSEVDTGSAAARQIVEYLARAKVALGHLPTQDTLVMERFFDESGGMQLVIHSPFGSRVNRAWGLALRKRFCRSFNFELQAAATEDAIVLSLSTSHSFPLDDVWRYLHSATAEHILIQALLDAPLFGVRWRWVATNALALPRYSGGHKTAPQLQRMRSEDLLATVFPDQVACLENVVGERELPSHPLVDQTLDDCLHEAMDTEAWLALLVRMERGEVRLIARDLPAPSPLAAEILNARPYAFLDDAPLEERRTQAVLNRRWGATDAGDMGALDAEAIDGVRQDAWPQARNADEMHEALMNLGCLTSDEAQAHPGWPPLLADLARSGHATQLQSEDGARRWWTPIERLTMLQAAHPSAHPEPCLVIPAGHDRPWARDDAILELVRARMGASGPLTPQAIAHPLALALAEVDRALIQLETEGTLMRGRFSPGADGEEWCERHLLARIHRRTVQRLRRDIEPVEPRQFMRFLIDWQHLSPDTQGQGRDALLEVLHQLEGYQAAAGAWEADILTARVADYSPHWLDGLCQSGRILWARLGCPPRVTEGGATASTGGPVRSTPIVLLPRLRLSCWSRLVSSDTSPALSPRAALVHEALSRHGALFQDELSSDLRLLGTEVEHALSELVGRGLAHADSFAGLRTLLLPEAKRHARGRRARHHAAFELDNVGRWSLLRRPATSTPPEGDELEHIVRALLRRYGVVFWRLLEREAPWLPPWRELLRVLHRLEARGDIRGGRFIAGLAGEQFALPEAIPLLRDMRRRPEMGQFTMVSGADPLNVVGTLLAGEKVPAIHTNRVLYHDGLPVAALVAGRKRIWQDLGPALNAQVHDQLMRTVSRGSAPLIP